MSAPKNKAAPGANRHGSENIDTQHANSDTNFEQASRFSDTLTRSDQTPLRFLTFDDHPKGKRPDLVRTLHGTLEEHWAELCRLNAAGAGIFVTVNETDLRGRKAENITKVRALFVDLDDPDPEAHRRLIDDATDAIDKPHIIVNSGRGMHAYWLVNDCELGQFSNLQKMLAERFGGDPAVCDLPRVMRLPGTVHRKGEPRPVVLESVNPAPPLSVDSIVTAFGLRSASPERKEASQAQRAGASPSLAELEEVLAKLPDKFCVERNLWFRTMCSVRHRFDGSHDALVVFDKWSSKAPNYVDFDDVEKTWNSIDLREHPRTWSQLLRDAGLTRAVEDDVERLAKVDPTEWQEPQPITAELKPVPPFDADRLLPDALRGWVMDEAERMPCPPDFIAVAALVALGSVIGARCTIKPKSHDNWLIVPNLWGGIVGDPSAKKSPAIGAALKPLDRLIAQASDAHRVALANFKDEQVVFDAQKAAIEGRIKEAAKKASKGDPANIAKELREHSDHAPEAPTLRRYKTNDSTVEKLGELLRDNRTGVLVLRDELVGLLATWEKEGREGERAFFLEAWNGNQHFDTDRIGRGHIHIENVCASIFGGIQPDKLVGYLEQACRALGNDGMLQRFQLLVFPDARQWEWRDRAPDKAARDAAFNVFEKLADLDPAACGASPADSFCKFPHFCFDEDAQTVLIEWMHDLECTRIPKEDTPIIRQHLSKFNKLFPALALIFHLVGCVSAGVCGAVGRKAALRAAAWCEYLEAHARRCYGLLLDDGLRAAQALSVKLVQGVLQDGFTARDVRRNQWRGLTTDEAVQAAVDWLEDEGWLRSEPIGGTGPGGGRRSQRYAINPAVKGGPHKNGESTREPTAITAERKSIGSNGSAHPAVGAKIAGSQSPGIDLTGLNTPPAATVAKVAGVAVAEKSPRAAIEFSDF